MGYKKYIIKSDSDLVQGKKFKIDYENCLNPQQLDAVKHIDGPALVIAGAGWKDQNNHLQSSLFG